MNANAKYLADGANPSGTPRLRRDHDRSFSAYAASWAPLVLLPACTMSFRSVLPPWVFMWLLAFAIFMGCKWLTWWQCEVSPVRPGRTWAYLFAWPGLDARGFLSDREHIAKPSFLSWTVAVFKTLFGALLLWGMVRMQPASSPLLTGWCGLFGLIFLLHFGTFHLLALAWQRAGVNARPLMRAPILATSLGEFWGKRWNSAFHELVFHFAFRPLRRRANPTAATLIVFLLSGLIHELVISLPAHGGYGFPTAYFLIQGLGIIGEHARLGRRIGLGRGLPGWLFVLLVTAGPAFCLFHPSFIRNVILPMLHAIGAT
jgi:hypothetical protein